MTTKKLIKAEEPNMLTTTADAWAVVYLDVDHKFEPSLGSSREVESVLTTKRFCQGTNHVERSVGEEEG